MERLTLARIGFNLGSKACSVMLKPVIRTGSTRLSPHTNSVNGAFGAATSLIPARSSASLVIIAEAFGYSSISREASVG